MNNPPSQPGRRERSFLRLAILFVLFVHFLGATLDVQASSVLPARALPAGVLPASTLPASGLPGSTEFGYGGRLDPFGPEVELAIKTAANAGMQWVGMDFDWAVLWPDPNLPPDLSAIDRAMALIQADGLAAALSITHAPAWALTPTGPDATQTVALITTLASRYRGILQIIELFPYANQLRGWGVPPNPAHYSALLQSAQTALAQAGSPILTVAAGLAPLGQMPAPEDVDDLAYLEALYAAGAAAFMPVLSLRLDGLSGEAKASPITPQNPVLRHYEEIRQVMIVHQHAHGLIWITSYSWPANLNGAPPKDAVHWLSQALYLMKSQLYIGAAFFNQLNQPSPGSQTASAAHSLIQIQNGAITLHPAVDAFAQFIRFGHTGPTDTVSAILSKMLITGPRKSALKLSRS